MNISLNIDIQKTLADYNIVSFIDRVQTLIRNRNENKKERYW